MVRPSPRNVPLLLSLAGMATTGYAAWLGHQSPTCFEKGATLMLASMALLSIAATAGARHRLQRGLTCGLFLLMAGVLLSSLLGNQLFTVDPFHDPRYASFLVGLIALNILGLIRGAILARWLSLALGAGGVLSGALNLANVGSTPNPYGWSLAIGVAGSLLILANIIGQKQREHFEKSASPLWSSPDPLLRSIRLTIISFMAAIPMLLVYAWMQPIVPETASTALPLAAFLAASIVASSRRWVLGAVGLVVGGFALLAQAAATFILASDLGHVYYTDIALYYAIFWVPAAVASLVCGARLAAPLIALLRERD